MTVYFAMTLIDQSKVKIGFTSDLESRRANMSVSVPGGVRILASMPGGIATEEYLHDKFAEFRFSGEWFEYCSEIKDFIERVQINSEGLVPFVDEAGGFHRKTSEYARDAVEIARQMAVAVLNDEFRGVGDTIDAAMFRVEQKHDISSKVFHRLRYRTLKDIWAGEFLHIKSIYEQVRALHDSTSAIVGLADFVAGTKEKAKEEG